MSKTAVVFTCAHSDPSVPNDRFNWLGSLLYDVRPDYVVDLGDFYDMRSLNTFDTRYPSAIVAQSYERDIDHGLDAQERIRYKFRHMKRKRPAFYGFEGNHECFQGHTEILVKGKGWVKAPKVKEDDYVLTMNGWEPVEKTHKFWHSGGMVSFSSLVGKFSVTPSHRVYYYTSGGNLKVKEAKDTPVSLDLPVSGYFGKGVDLTNNQIKFNAVAATDSYHKKDSLVFYQSGSKADTIRQLIETCGVPYREVKRDRSVEEICGKKLKSCQVSYEFHMKRPEWCTDNNKSLPNWVELLSEEQYDTFMEMLVFCDGTIPTGATNSLVFYGKLPICKDVQLSAQMHGYRASITEYREGQYRVNLTKTNKLRVKKEEGEAIEDWVYCLTVPSGNFFARQGDFHVFTGNCRIKKAITHDPRLEGETRGISFKHLETDRFYDEYHQYANSAPSIASYDGVSYSHFFSSGNYGTAMSGEHHAFNLLKKRHSSATCGHSHKRSLYFKDDAFPRPSIGLVAGCFKGAAEGWAGQANNEWWSGVIIKRQIEDGSYEPQFVSLSTMEKEYG